MEPGNASFPVDYDRTIGGVHHVTPNAIYQNAITGPQRATLTGRVAPGISASVPFVAAPEENQVDLFRPSDLEQIRQVREVSRRRDPLSENLSGLVSPESIRMMALQAYAGNPSLAFGATLGGTSSRLL